jgi:preprotein translocase subunit SecG
MPRSVATEIREGNPGALTAVAPGHRLLAHMTENEPRSRLLRWVIWLATLFFVAMLFVPLVREALRRAALVPPGHF